MYRHPERIAERSESSDLMPAEGRHAIIPGTLPTLSRTRTAGAFLLH